MWIALTLLTNSSCISSLTTSFLTIWLSLLKSIGVLSNLPITSLLISDFKLAKSKVLANFDVSTVAAFFKSVFVA